MSLREAILAAGDLKREEVEVQEWGCKVVVRELSGAERGELEQKIAESMKAGTFRQDHRALAVIAGTFDAEGNRIFGYGDLAAVSAKSGKTLERLGHHVDRLNKLSDEELEALAKN